VTNIVFRLLATFFGASFGFARDAHINQSRKGQSAKREITTTVEPTRPEARKFTGGEANFLECRAQVLWRNKEIRIVSSSWQ
jgi:hypothetical protein